MVKMILILQIIFILRLIKISINQTEYSKLEQRPVNKFSLVRTTNHVKFTEECAIYLEKHFFKKNIVYKSAKHRFATTKLC